MKYHSPILTICLTISTGCLVAGYVIAGYWLILPVLCVMPLFWIYTKSRSVFWSASSLLLIYIVLAAIGIIAGIPMMLMMPEGSRQQKRIKGFIQECDLGILYQQFGNAWDSRVLERKW